MCCTKLQADIIKNVHSGAILGPLKKKTRKSTKLGLHGPLRPKNERSGAFSDDLENPKSGRLGKNRARRKLIETN